MKIVFANDTFKGSLTSKETALLLDKAARFVFKDIETVKVPLSDGGVGLLDAVITASGGRKETVCVHDPLMGPVEASYAIIKDKLAVIDMTLVCGIELIDGNLRDSRYTTSYGMGELIRHALDSGCEYIVIGTGETSFEDGGMGFDFRLAMNIPDYWIKTIKEQADENWKPSSIFWELTNRRAGERTVSYCESHDQALVGDKTIIFRLIDADMYWHFKKGDENETARRGIALHKMIRLVTATTLNGGYLNFMGNEFGHPEWIDFPREGNGWSHKYARRQWNLVDNKELCYHWLGDFDREMLSVIKSQPRFRDTKVQEVWHNDDDQILAYTRGDLLFVFNFSPTRSYEGYGFMMPEGAYDVVLNTDATVFGGNGLADDSVRHFTNFDPLLKKDGKGWLKLYVPARSAVVLRKVKE